MSNKYFVTKSNGGYMVISDAFDGENGGGHYYKAESKEYKTEALAIVQATLMNNNVYKTGPSDHLAVLIPLLEYNYSKGRYIDVLNVIGLEVYGIESETLIKKTDREAVLQYKQRAYNEIENLKSMNGQEE